MKLTISSARKLAVSAQGLAAPLSSALEAIEHLGYVQIDTISVVERAHHHVLWNRDPDYRPEVLAGLLKERKVFEYWSHAASYLPMNEYRFYQALMKDISTGKQTWWFEPDKKEIKKVLERIKRDGPLQAKDFEPPASFKAGPWFTRKPSKKALDQLVMEGKLMISERKGFQKVYDLKERVLPKDLDTSFPSPQELARFLVRRTLRSHGLASEAEIVYLNLGLRSSVRKALSQMVKSHEIVPVEVNGHTEDLFAFQNALDEVSEDKSGSNSVQILSPFDSLVIQRKRLKWLFDFDYQIECYVPAKKRKFGYFCLPLLWVRDGTPEVVGRMDAKAVRAERVLKIESIHVERELSKSKRHQFDAGFRKSVDQFAHFNQCDEIDIKS